MRERENQCTYLSVTALPERTEQCVQVLLSACVLLACMLYLGSEREREREREREKEIKRERERESGV